MKFDAHKLRLMPDGSVRESQSDTLNCNSCAQNFSRQERGGHYSCIATCSYDLCIKCARCPEGHTLKRQYGNPYPDNGVFCDRCKVNLSEEQLRRGYSRCPADNYDVCRECIPGGDPVVNF